MDVAEVKRTVIFEVLPLSTEGYDWHYEFNRCRLANDMLTDYVFIVPEQPFIEHFRKRNDGNWCYQSSSDMSHVIKVGGIGIKVRLSEIYDRVVLANGPKETDIRREEGEV